VFAKILDEQFAVMIGIAADQCRSQGDLLMGGKQK